MSGTRSEAEGAEGVTTPESPETPESASDDIDVEAILSRARPLGFNFRNYSSEPEFVQKLEPLLSVKQGDGVVFGCRYKGFPKPRVRWLKDNEDLVAGGRYMMEEDVSWLYLRLSRTDKWDEGTYRCKIENEEGSAATTCYLEVKVFDEDLSAASSSDNVFATEETQHEHQMDVDVRDVDQVVPNVENELSKLEDNIEDVPAMLTEEPDAGPSPQIIPEDYIIDDDLKTKEEMAEEGNLFIDEDMSSKPQDFQSNIQQDDNLSEENNSGEQGSLFVSGKPFNVEQTSFEAMSGMEENNDVPQKEFETVAQEANLLESDYLEHEEADVGMVRRDDITRRNIGLVDAPVTGVLTELEETEIPATGTPDFPISDLQGGLATSPVIIDKGIPIPSTLDITGNQMETMETGDPFTDIQGGVPTTSIPSALLDTDVPLLDSPVEMPDIDNSVASSQADMMDTDMSSIPSAGFPDLGIPFTSDTGSSATSMPDVVESSDSNSWDFLDRPISDSSPVDHSFEELQPSEVGTVPVQMDDLINLTGPGETAAHVPDTSNTSAPELNIAGEHVVSESKEGQSVQPEVDLSFADVEDAKIGDIGVSNVSEFAHSPNEKTVDDTVIPADHAASSPIIQAMENIDKETNLPEDLSSYPRGEEASVTDNTKQTEPNIGESPACSKEDKQDIDIEPVKPEPASTTLLPDADTSAAESLLAEDHYSQYSVLPKSPERVSSSYEERPSFKEGDFISTESDDKMGTERDAEEDKSSEEPVKFDLQDISIPETPKTPKFVQFSFDDKQKTERDIPSGPPLSDKWLYYCPPVGLAVCGAYAIEMDVGWFIILLSMCSMLSFIVQDLLRKTKN